MSTQTQRYLVSLRSEDGSVLHSELGVIDDFGSRIWHQALTGWWDSPPIEVISDPIGNTGRSVSPVTFAVRPREITIVGKVVTASADDGILARRRLIQQWGKLRSGTYRLVVEEPDITKFAYVKLNGKVECDWEKPAKSFVYSIPLIANDPFLYADDEVEFGPVSPDQGGEYATSWNNTWNITWDAVGSGSIADTIVVSPGSEDSYPVFTLTGTLKRGWTIYNLTNGDSISADTEVRSDQTLVLNARTRSVTVNGTGASIAVTGDAFRISPGSNTLKIVAPLGSTSGQMSGVFSPAYI